MKVTVRFVFGRRQTQDLPGYSSGATAPFVFTIMTDAVPSSWWSAYALLGFYREAFIAACQAAQTSSWQFMLMGADVRIPAGYLDRPTIEVSAGGNIYELLVDGQPPNPWLSLGDQAA